MTKGPGRSSAAESIGARIRRARKKRGLTTAQLATLAKVSEAAIKKVESENSKAPSLLTGLRIASWLGVDPLWIAFGDESLAVTFDEIKNYSPNLKDHLVRLAEERLWNHGGTRAQREAIRRLRAGGLVKDGRPSFLVKDLKLFMDDPTGYGKPATATKQRKKARQK